MAMPWDTSQDFELLDFYREIIRERQAKEPWVR
jgi:hypothetical protein